MSNKIKVARAKLRESLPVILSYGEVVFINKKQLIIGNNDDTDFVVNEWNNILNKPNIEVHSSIVSGNIEAGRAVKMIANGSVNYANSTSLVNAHVFGIALDDALDGDVSRIQYRGVVENSSWTWTPGDTIYLSNTSGNLVAGLAIAKTYATISYIGTALSATKILLNIKDPYIAYSGIDGVAISTDREVSVEGYTRKTGISIPANTTVVLESINLTASYTDYIVSVRDQSLGSAYTTVRLSLTADGLNTISDIGTLTYTGTLSTKANRPTIEVVTTATSANLQIVGGAIGLTAGFIRRSI